MLAKDIDGGFSRFFYFPCFFVQVSKTTHFPKVQQNEPPLFAKVKAMRMLRLLFVAEQRFQQMRMLRLLFARSYLQVN